MNCKSNFFPDKNNLSVRSNKAFTLLELIIVIVIIGILATLGFTQYTSVIENMRGAEAKANLGLMRKNYTAFYLNTGSNSGMVNADLGIGTPPGQLPNSCDSNYYFSYSWWLISGTNITMAATRCTSGGKSPTSSTGYSWYLDYDPATGGHVWECWMGGARKWAAAAPASCPSQ